MTGGFLAAKLDLRRRLNCRSKYQNVTTILEVAVIVRILTDLRLQARAPPRVAAREDFQQAA